MEYVLQTDALTKVYGGVKVVNEVGMHVEKGSIYGFIGKNGAGKTTFMRMAAGLAAPTSGSVTLFGSGEPERQRMRIGTLIENPGVFGGMTARENLEIVRRSLGIPEKKRIDGLLELTGLSGAGRKKVKNFSMGMRQRLGLAIALIRKPNFLILDEPINGLDPSGIREIRDLLLKLNREEHVTVLITSHILGELSKIATRYGILRDGVLIEEIGADQLDVTCRRYLKLTVDDAQRAAAVLTEKLGISSTVADAHTICVFEKLDTTEEINYAVAANGIALKESRLAGEDLESYFMERMGERPLPGGGFNA